MTRFDDCLDPSKTPPVRVVGFFELWKEESRDVFGTDRREALRKFVWQLCAEAFIDLFSKENAILVIEAVSGLDEGYLKKAAYRDVFEYVQEHHPVARESRKTGESRPWELELATWFSDLGHTFYFDWALWNKVQDKDRLRGVGGLLDHIEKTGSQKDWPAGEDCSIAPFEYTFRNEGPGTDVRILGFSAGRSMVALKELVGWMGPDATEMLVHDHVNETIRRSVEGYSARVAEGQDEIALRSHAWLFMLTHLSPLIASRWMPALERLDEALPLDETVFALVEKGIEPEYALKKERLVDAMSPEQRECWDQFAQSAIVRHSLQSALARPVGERAPSFPGMRRL